MGTDREHRQRKNQYETEGTSARKLKLAVYREPAEEEEEYGYLEMPQREARPVKKPSGQPKRRTSGAQPQRKPSTQPERRKQKTKEPKRTAREQEERRLAPRSAAPGINFFSMLVLTAAIGITFFTCYSYLRVQADIHTLEKRTATLETKTAALADKNANTELAISNSVDLENVQKVAMEELGMVYPYNNQMITYEAGKYGYVRQYGELTGNEQESLLELLFRMFFSNRTPIPAEEGE